MCSCARHITRIGLGLCNNELRTVDTRHVTRDTGHRTPDTWKCSKAGNETNLFAWRVRGPNGWLPHCQLVEIPIHSIRSFNTTSRNFTIDSACKVNHRRVASSIIAVKGHLQICPKSKRLLVINFVYKHSNFNKEMALEGALWNFTHEVPLIPLLATRHPP